MVQCRLWFAIVQTQLDYLRQSIVDESLPSKMLLYHVQRALHRPKHLYDARLAFVRLWDTWMMVHSLYRDNVLVGTG
jgi:hypothetical protein